MDLFKKIKKEEEEGDLHIDVNAKTIKEGGIMKAIEEKEKEERKKQFEGQLKKNPLINWFKNVRNTKKNWTKVRASPYASLTLAIKFRKIVIGVVIAYMAYMTFDMVKKYPGTGFMALLGKLMVIGIMGYVAYTLYKTIPASKKQLEYYRKYPHLINYCPTDSKETVEDILKKIKENAENEKQDKIKKNNIQDRREDKTKNDTIQKESGNS